MRACWDGRRIQAQSNEIRSLHDQINGYRLQLDSAKARIATLTEKLTAALRHDADINPLRTLRDCILCDIFQNRDRAPKARRYSPETLHWAWRVHQRSPAAWKLVYDALPLPCERSLQTRFAQTGAVVAEALLDIDQLGTVVEKWEGSHPDTATDRHVIVSVDAVSFRPRVTISEDGEVEGLDDLTKLPDPDLFEQYLLHPKEFTEFLKVHWKHAYTAMFVFQIQPIQPHLPCCVIHVVPEKNGKGTADTVRRLLQLRDILDSQHGFTVVGFAFDGDSAYNDLHRSFKLGYERLLPDVGNIDLSSILLPDPGDLYRHAETHAPVVLTPNMNTIAFPDQVLDGLYAIICDPNHLEKRLRYRFVSACFSIGFGTECIIFSLDAIEAAGFLAPVVFDNSRITKMHDSLPLQLFSPVTFNWILHHPGPELVLAPWCLMTAALTLPEFNTKTRCDLLETGFWFLFLYERLLIVVGPPRGVNQKIPKEVGRFCVTLYTSDQIRDGLNTFASLISILRESPTPVCLNRLGSDPLEHSFGQARMRCWDVNTMNKMLRAFAYKIEDISERSFMALLDAPRRRHSIGVTCGPWSASPPSELTCTPFEIALSLFDEIGIDLSRVLRRPSQEVLLQVLRAPRAWKCLLRLKAFSSPMIGSSLGPSLQGTVFASFFGPRCGQTGSHERLRVLSSDQLFLGIIKSPRTDHLQASSSKMGKMLGTKYADTEKELERMYGHYVTAHEIGGYIHQIARILDKPGPERRARDVYLAWLDQYAPDSLNIYHRLLTQTYLGPR
jgi:hypothetical protein